MCVRCSLDVAVAFNHTTFIAYENNRLAQPVLVLSSIASYDITVVVSAIDVNATGELCVITFLSAYICMYVCTFSVYDGCIHGLVYVCPLMDESLYM